MGGEEGRREEARQGGASEAGKEGESETKRMKGTREDARQGGGREGRPFERS